MTPVSETDRPILGMVVGKEKTLMIDAGNSEEHAQLFLEMLKRTKCIESRFRSTNPLALGSIFGLPVLQDALSIAHSETKRDAYTCFL